MSHKLQGRIIESYETEAFFDTTSMRTVEIITESGIFCWFHNNVRNGSGIDAHLDVFSGGRQEYRL